MFSRPPKDQKKKTLESIGKNRKVNKKKDNKKNLKKKIKI
jgi:hypothetical protein